MVMMYDCSIKMSSGQRATLVRKGSVASQEVKMEATHHDQQWPQGWVTELLRCLPETLSLGQGGCCPSTGDIVTS